MQNTLYIKLGSGLAKERHVGSKGTLLDKAARAGLPVPKGVILLDTVWDQALLCGLIEVRGSQVVVPDSAALSQFLDLPAFSRPVAVRSAFSSEDREDESLAGYYESVLRVDATQPDQLAAALSQVLSPVMGTPTLTLEIPVLKASDSQSLPRFKRIRRDVLMMEMVEARQAGVAFTEREYEDDLINYTAGTAEKLVAGEIPGESLLLPKLRGWEKRPLAVSPHSWKARLQKLLRDVRQWGGGDDRDIEWADDGVKCWLVQIRPITRPVRRNEVFTIANHKEVLPPLPSTFMTSIVEACAGELFSYYRRFDRSLPQTRPMIEIFHGRPYLNLSLMSEMMRIFGLPTRLLTDSIGGAAGKQTGLHWRRVIINCLRLTLPRFALAQMFAVRSAGRATKRIQRRLKQPATTWKEAVELTRWLYQQLVTETFGLTAAIAPMLVMLRVMSVLDEHSARQVWSGKQTVSTRMYTDLEALRLRVQADGALKKRINELTPINGELPESLPDDFRQMWTDYLAEYGHRGIYESDLARPRYHEAPDELLSAIAAPVVERNRPPRRTLKGWLTLPVWGWANRLINVREQWRHDLMRGFNDARQSLLKLAAAKGIASETLWTLTIDEVKRLDSGWLPDAKFMEQRCREIERQAEGRLPDLLHRFDDLEQYYGDTEPYASTETQLTGISLTRGEISGQAWVLSEPGACLPPEFKPHETILVARAVDAGWIPTFAQVAGVVVETGGDLSHGSIILREVGLPAITNVSGAMQAIQTGDRLHLRAGVGVVQRISQPESVTEVVPPEGKITLDRAGQD